MSTTDSFASALAWLPVMALQMRSLFEYSQPQREGQGEVKET